MERGGGGRGLSLEREGSQSQYVRGSATSGPSSDLSSQLSSIHLTESAGDGEVAGSGHSLGRGATRGRRDRVDQFILRTKPDSVSSKQGTGGTSINLLR